MKLIMIILLPMLLWAFVGSCKQFRERYCEHDSDSFQFYSSISWIVAVGAYCLIGALYLFDKSICLCAAS